MPFPWTTGILIAVGFTTAIAQRQPQATFPKPGSAEAQPKAITVPKAWDDGELSEWATPLAALGLRPAHFSEAELAKVPIYFYYRSYPVYHPDREPPGYWEWLQSRRPEPLINPAELHTKRDWIQAGQTVFRELHFPPSSEPQDEAIALVRSREALRRAGVEPDPDGTIGMRWVVTPNRIRVAPQECQACHTRVLPDGMKIEGAPLNREVSVLLRLQKTVRQPVRGPEETARIRNQFLHSYSLPWLKDDVHKQFQNMSLDDFEELDRSLVVGVFTRDDGSPFYPTKVPDLIGIRDRKYIDHTATHRHRGIGDLMRYAMLVACCASGGFGPDRQFRPAEGFPKFRLSDELLYALAMYIYSLKPPINPNPFDAAAMKGKEIFAREGCPACHTPPLYTNNRLTLAKGFTPPADHPNREDILPVSVGTDPGTATRTRKGTGFYKVPSLRGVWYRGHYGHDGSVTTLEEWFDPARLRDNYVPSGWKGYRITHRAVPGHEFGLGLPAQDRSALIAFLKTL